MLTVAKLSKLVHTTPVSIRYYLRIGLLSPDRDEDNGYHLFQADDIRRLKFILLSKRLGFSLRDIQTMLEYADQRRSPAPVVRDLIRQRLDENRQQMAELNALQAEMTDALKRWESLPDDAVDGNEIARLIASIPCFSGGRE